MGGACSTHEADEKYITKFWLECLKGIDHSQDLGVDVKLLLKLMLRKCVRGSGYGPVAGSCEHGNEASSSIKDVLLAYKKNCALWG
jgi:hypothetical protein